MGLRFHRALKLSKGLKLNLSKTGPSLSVGGKGLSVNLGRRGLKQTVSLPGSGISYSAQKRLGARRSYAQWLLILILAALAYLWAQPDHGIGLLERIMHYRN